MPKPIIISLIVATGVLVSCSKAPDPERTQWHGEKLGYPDYRLPEETFFQKSDNFKEGRKVYAWYMPCTAVFPSWDDATVEQREENFLAEMQMAQSMGIDGFGLDIMIDNENYHRSIEAMFRAAKRFGNGFKLFFEFDYGQPGLEARAADILMLMKKYAGLEAYERVNGRPLVSAYSPDNWVEKDGKPDYAGSAEWWRENVTQPLREAGIEMHFAPNTFRQLWSGDTTPETSAAELAEWGDTIQGLSLWHIQLSPKGGGLRQMEKHGKSIHEAGKTWRSTVAMHYWHGAGRSVPSWYWRPGDPKATGPENGNYYEHGGGEGLDAQWRSIIDIQKPESVTMLTWNDYNESYIIPVDNIARYRNGSPRAPEGWYKSMVGLDELNRYYIQWYKTGVPPRITKDALFYSYRTSSHTLVAAMDPRPPVGIGLPPAEDVIFITTALTAPAQVRVVSGTETKQFDAPAGIHHLAVPFLSGRQSFSLWRDGKEIAVGSGPDVVDKIDFYDFWPATGFIRAN